MPDIRKQNQLLTDTGTGTNVYKTDVKNGVKKTTNTLTGSTTYGTVDKSGNTSYSSTPTVQKNLENTYNTNPAQQISPSGSDVYGAMMDFLGNLSNKWDSFINNWTKKGKDENAMNMAYALRQHKKVYNPENNNGQGLSKLMDIYNTKAKNDRSVEDTASEMAMNKNGSLYNNAFNLVNSAGANSMTADQIRKLYSRF